MRQMPALPRLLGLAGLWPQLAAVMALYGGPPEWRDTAQHSAIAYAAVTLAFLGGAWWGMAAGAPAAERRGMLGWLWFASVGMMAFAFAGLLLWMLNRLPAEPVLVMLGAALLMSPGVDAKLGALAPRWWMSLRVPLSIAMGAATAAAAFA